MRERALCLMAAWLVAACAMAADVPYLTGRVVDNAEILSAPTRQKLESTLKAHEELTGNQVAIKPATTVGNSVIWTLSQQADGKWYLADVGASSPIPCAVPPATTTSQPSRGTRRWR